MDKQHFEVRLKRSTSGMSSKLKAVVTGLGLRRMNKPVHLMDTPEIRGMLYKVSHWVAVEPKSGPVPQRGKRHSH